MTEYIFDASTYVILLSSLIIGAIFSWLAG